ncbi:hypothetical protein N7539_000631 [Penicillium diatomitis]|uniref:Uncharacterized protein n=1 Tax=Penicillium diatomitis TaxID=2819901 RepID=A0A9W9XN27_9EURO|nr:uncharacterized protein N7539_000631 [Penicillium diatomitis]KAJ5495515.1 hypothetical protein N7539_000631 [Penicillium diatomitis]
MSSVHLTDLTRQIESVVAAATDTQADDTNQLPGHSYQTGGIAMGLFDVAAQHTDASNEKTVTLS